MTLNEFENILKLTELPVAYHHFNSITSPSYIVYYLDDTDCFGADNIVYIPKMNIIVELYTPIKDVEKEELLERTLTDKNIYFEKSENWIEKEKRYQIIYEIEVF